MKKGRALARPLTFNLEPLASIPESAATTAAAVSATTAGPAAWPSAAVATGATATAALIFFAGFLRGPTLEHSLSAQADLSAGVDVRDHHGQLIANFANSFH
jgi:hypothetical protein